jgi:hypothetical protein
MDQICDSETRALENRNASRTSSGRSSCDITRTNMKNSTATKRGNSPVRLPIEDQVMQSSSSGQSTKVCEVQLSTARCKPRQLFDLPVEILIIILKYVPPAGKAATTISCRKAKTVIGDQYLSNLKSYKDKSELLDMLQRDMMKLIHCKRCNTVLDSAKIFTTPPPFIVQARKSPSWCLCKCGHRLVCFTDFDRFRISAGFLNLLCRNLANGILGNEIRWWASIHCQGGYLGGNREIDGLSSTMWSSQRFRREMWQMRAKVVENSLLIRSQHWIYIPTWVKAIGCGESIQKTLLHVINDNLICTHSVMFPLSEIEIYVQNAIQRVPKPSDSRDKSAFRNSLIRCSSCLTDCQIRYKELSNGKEALVITVWKDLGCLRDPRCLKLRGHLLSSPWKSGATGYPCCENNSEAKGHPGIQMEIGTIARAFEGTWDMDVDSDTLLPHSLQDALLKRKPPTGFLPFSCSCCRKRPAVQNYMLPRHQALAMGQSGNKDNETSCSHPFPHDPRMAPNHILLAKV